MGYDPKKVINIALGEVGYLEKETNDQLDDMTANAGDENYTKYARDLDKLGFYNGRKQHVAWCDVFVDWVFVIAYGMDAALALTFQPYGKSNCGAGCKYSRQYYQKNGHLFDKPERGDQIFFYSKDKTQISHTGLVYAVDIDYVYTVEGNTLAKSGVVANGGAVAKKMYKHSYERIAGFGRPDWDMENNITSEDKPVTLYPSADYELGDRTLRKGDKGSDVKAMQAMLISLGYDLGSTGADGNFGSKTEKAVKAYQTESCLNADGVYGQKTHAALMASVVPKPNPDEPVPMPPTTDTTKWLTITGYSVNARVGDSEQYDSVGHLNKGDAIEYVATAPNGWNAGRWKERIVWVSPDYSTITTS